MTDPTTTAQATVQIPPPPEPQEEQMCSCGRLPLIDGIGLCEPCLREVEQWERIEALQHQRAALAEQVRVLRGALSESEFAMNAVKNDVPWHVKDECMFDEALHIARRALAALEGSGE